jgi:hypothetical protein
MPRRPLTNRLARLAAPLLLLPVAVAPGGTPAAAQGAVPQGAVAPAAQSGASTSAAGASTSAAGASASAAGTTTSTSAGAVESGGLSPAPATRPFGPGEALHYEVRFGSLKVGSGSMEVRGVESIRGRPAYHTVFRVKGGTLFFKVDDTFESWFATDDLSSLRFHKDQNEGFKERDTRYEIFPERQMYDETTDPHPEQSSVATPLDDGSFLYFVRTVPLEVGKTYRFERYFKPERNPVTIHVLRRERVKVPAGEFDAVVVRPSIKTKGIFSEGGRAEVWLSDDDRRVVLQVKSRLSFGSLNLYLRSMKPGSGVATR